MNMNSVQKIGRVFLVLVLVAGLLQLQPTSRANANGAAFVIQIEAGTTHSMALKSNGTVWAWGINSNGELGDGTTTDQLAPKQVIDIADSTGFLSGVATISGSGEYSLAIKNDRTVWTWGYGYDGQLGDGTTGY
jgi:alpha-tubulin suppressor-like RCC1 family protein